MIDIDPSSLDFDRVETAKVARNLTFSLLIPARGKAAADALGDIIERNHRQWMQDHNFLDEIGIHIDPDENGDTFGMEEIALSAGATWTTSGTAVAKMFSGAEASSIGGKAATMRNLAYMAMGSNLVFHDADHLDYDPDTVGLLVAGMALGGGVRLVNGSPSRKSGSGAGGRTTEMIRSLVSKQLHPYIPDFTAIRQPLIGEFAIDARLFSSIEIARGYGVEMSLKALAMHYIEPDKFAQIPLPPKGQDGQDYLDLVKQFHEIGFTIDVLERYFQLRAEGRQLSARTIAHEYHDHFPGRTVPLLRPEGYDEMSFVPRRRFYRALGSEISYHERRNHTQVMQAIALSAIERKHRHFSIPSIEDQRPISA